MTKIMTKIMVLTISLLVNTILAIHQGYLYHDLEFPFKILENAFIVYEVLVWLAVLSVLINSQTFLNYQKAEPLRKLMIYKQLKSTVEEMAKPMSFWLYTARYYNYLLVVSFLLFGDWSLFLGLLGLIISLRYNKFCAHDMYNRVPEPIDDKEVTIIHE